MRIGDEVAAVAAFHTREEAKQWVEAQWAEKKLLWHDATTERGRRKKMMPTRLLRSPRQP